MKSKFVEYEMVKHRKEVAEHTFDFTSTSLLVKALGITLLNDMERSINEDLDKAETSLLVQLTGDSTVSAVGRDEGSGDDATCIREQLRDLNRDVS